MCLVRGAFAYVMDDLPNAENIFPDMEKVLKQTNVVNDGERVVFTAGLPTLESHSTNTVTFRVIGRN